jgi:anaerobic magnesium-protoporphyrin IX monomethyl ester cyclase
MAVDCVFAKYTGPERRFNQFIPDLGLAYLSAALKEAGYTCELLHMDLPGNSPQDLLDYVARHKPRMLGIKLMRRGLPTLIALAEEVKKISPSTLVVGGGPHARICQETIFTHTNGFDALLIGEGDRAITQIVEVAHGERTLHDVDNVVFHEDGCLVKSPISVIEDLDALPLPDWSLFDLERYPPIFLVSARKGCPYACAFCNYNFIDSHKTVDIHISESGAIRVTRSVRDRKRTLPSLRREILNNVERYGVRLFGLTDSLADPRTVSQVCDWLIEARLDTRWTSFGRIKHMDRLFEKMAHAGWVSLWFGVESGSEKVLKRMNKHYTRADILQTLNTAHNAGIQCSVGFVLGFPGEDESTLAETLELAREIAFLDGVVFTPYHLNPGSLVGEMPDYYGVSPLDDWLERYAYTPDRQELHDIVYFEVEGEDNVSRHRRLLPLVDHAYETFLHHPYVDDPDYMQLLISVMDEDPSAGTFQVDNILASEDFAKWEEFLARAWQAVRNVG